MGISHRIKKAREYRNIPPEVIAKRLMITVEQYTGIEEIEELAEKMTVFQLLEMAKILGVSTDDILGSATLATEDHIGTYKLKFEDYKRKLYDRNGKYLGTVPLQWGRFRVGSWLQGYEAGYKQQEEIAGFLEDLLRD